MNRLISKIILLTYFLSSILLSQEASAQINRIKIEGNKRFSTDDVIRISNIYPNPFNPITRIEYSLPENADIELIVYNIHGRHIQTLVQNFQTAGFYSINWNASNYPSGVYLIRLENRNFSFLPRSGETGLGKKITQIHKTVLIK